MKPILQLLLLITLLNPAFGQKHQDIPQTKIVEEFIEILPQKMEELGLKDLRTSEDSLVIRIWQPHEVFTLNYSNPVSSNYKIYTTSSELVCSSFSVPDSVLLLLVNSLPVDSIMRLQNDEFRGVDGSYVFMEIVTEQHYKIVSYWSPNLTRSKDCKLVAHTIDMIDNAIDSKYIKNTFLNDLPSGDYRWGMTNVRIDRFLGENIAKSDFYCVAESEIKKKLCITEETNHWEYPLILVNNSPVKLTDLNQYKKNDVARFEVYIPDDKLKALYGTKSMNGVVVVETK